MSPHFLAFDLGAESGRVLAGALEGERLTLTEKHRFANPSGRMHGRWQWNLLAQWEALKTGLRLGVEAGARRLDIRGIGIDTWGVDFGLLDANGEVLGNPFHYRDGRTDGIMEKVFARVAREKIFATTGIQFMQFNTLFQLCAMQQAQDPALKKARTLLFMPDLFNYLFTGVAKSEFSIASTSQMLDIKTGQWARPMLAELGLPVEILPELVKPATTLGPLSEEVRRECDVDAIPVIAPGCHDTASAVVAVPAEGDSWCYISSGTWSLMGVEVDAPIVNEKSRTYNYTNEGGVGGKVRFLRNIMGLWLVQECRRHWVSRGNDHSYGELSQMAARAPGFAAVIDPDDKPFLLPGDMPGRIEEYCRRTHQSVPSSRGEFVRTCLDTLALAYRRALEGLEDMLGRRIGVIHIVGGGCQNDLLNQMTANACGRAVIAGPVEATAMGNILTQAMAAGEVKSLAQARQIVRASSQLKRFDPVDVPKWDKFYARYREIVAG